MLHGVSDAHAARPGAHGEYACAVNAASGIGADPGDPIATAHPLIEHDPSRDTFPGTRHCNTFCGNDYGLAQILDALRLRRNLISAQFSPANLRMGPTPSSLARPLRRPVLVEPTLARARYKSQSRRCDGNRPDINAHILQYGFDFVLFPETAGGYRMRFSFLTFLGFALVFTAPNAVNGRAGLTMREGSESVSCYDDGTKADRARLTSAIDKFCTDYGGRTVNDGDTIQERYDYGDITIFVSGTAINGCNFVVDDNCNRLLRLPVDKCNTGGENDKQGGVVTDICGQWRTDPGANGDDY
ncbi:putative LysM domain-containing protein [Mycena kentingensis (nom. inval.)]|nr:putative LysM domain-containing protein [Mycena kentingensis (nom. inval.)]